MAAGGPQSAALAAPDDKLRHSAARLLSAFEGAEYALGAADWLQERARPVLTPSRPESLQAATALRTELTAALRARTLRGRLGLGGPGCALTCRAVQRACGLDCHGTCDARYRKCLKRCKRRRTLSIGTRQDVCR